MKVLLLLRMLILLFLLIMCLLFLLFWCLLLLVVVLPLLWFFNGFEVELNNKRSFRREKYKLLLMLLTLVLLLWLLMTLVLLLMMLLLWLMTLLLWLMTLLLLLLRRVADKTVGGGVLVDFRPIQVQIQHHRFRMAFATGRVKSGKNRKIE